MSDVGSVKPAGVGKMSYLQKLFHGLSADEDEEALKQMWAWYGPLLHWSLIFPRYSPGNLTLTLILWFSYIIIFSFHIVLFTWSVVLELETLKLWGLLFHYELLIAFAMMCIIHINTKRKLVAEYHRVLAGDLGSYPGGRIYLEKEPIRMKKTMDRESLVFMVAPFLIGIVGGSVVIVPYLAKLGTDVESYTKNGVNLNLPIPLYYPFPTHEGILHLVAVGSQLTISSVVALVIVTLLLSLIQISQKLKYEYQVLGYALKTLFRRAAQLYRINHPGEPKIKTFDPLYQNYVGRILRECVIHHLKIVESLESFDEAQIKWVGAFAYAVGTGSIGLSLITILTALDSKSYQDVVVFTMLGLSEVLSLLLLSLVGETITSESKNLRDQLYDIEWHKLNIQNRKTMLNFQVGITEPYIMRAGGLVDVCLDTFSSIMNSSYSFFNLMNAGIDGS